MLLHSEFLRDHLSSANGLRGRVIAPRGKRERCVFASFAWALVPLIVAGCGGGPALPPLAPVKGVIAVDSQPITSGQVTLAPVILDSKQQLPAMAGQIDSAGSYEIFTGGKAGAPLGKYKVVVTPSMVPMQGAKGPPKTSFNEKFQKADKTTLQIEVVAEPPPGAYDLKLTR